MSLQWWLNRTTADITPDSNAHRALTTSAGTAITVSATATQIGPISLPGIQIIAPVVQTILSWWSPQLVGVTISGNILFNIFCRETNLAANAMLLIELFRTDYAGRPISSLGQFTSGLELSNGISPVVNFVGTPLSTVFQNGDRLLCILYIVDAPTGLMQSGFQVQTRYGGALTTAGESYMIFTDDLTTLSPTIGQTHLLPSQGAGG